MIRHLESGIERGFNAGLRPALSAMDSDLDRIPRIRSQRDHCQTDVEEAADEMESTYRAPFPGGSHSRPEWNV